MRTYRSIMQMTAFQFRNMMRNKIAVFFNLVLPLIFLAVFGSMFNTSIPAQEAIGLVDQDQGAVAQALRQGIEGSGLYKVSTGEEGPLLEQLAKGQLRAVLIIPQGTSQRAASKQGPGTIRIVSDPSSQAATRVIGGLQPFISSLGAQPLLVPKFEAPPNMANLNVFDFLLPGQLTYMMLSAGIVTIAIWLAQQRQAGSMRHLFSTPLSMRVWILSRILANLALMAVQTLVLYGVAIALFKVHLPQNLMGTGLIIALGALGSLGLGLTVGGLVRSPESAMPIAMILYMGLSFFGGAMMPLDSAPAIMQSIAAFMPSSYMTHALRLVMMQGKGLGEVVPDLLVMAGCAVVFIGLATWRLRKQFVTA